MKNKYKEATIELENGERWTIVHNLPDTFGMNIDGAINNYLARTDNPTPKGFCEYVMSKDPNFKAWHKEAADKLR